MDEYYSPANIQALATLLCPPKEDEDEDSWVRTFFAQRDFPVILFYPQRTILPSSRHKSQLLSAFHGVTQTSDGVWAVRYEIVLEQSVGTEDLFLGLSRKDPSSVSCENMLVKVRLPSTDVSEVDLDVKEKFLDLRTPKFKLGLHLPHPVWPHKGKARFFAERDVLEVTLPMNRWLDDVNLA
ncbi:protein PIH1D3 [Arapaima gigas]